MTNLSQNQEETILQKKNKSIKNQYAFISGACGGISLVISSHPFDLIKVRLQTGFYGTPSPSPLKAAWITYQNQGLKGLYKGAFPVICGSVPTLGLNFWSFELGKSFLLDLKSRHTMVLIDASLHESDQLPVLSLVDIGIAGSFAGLVTSSIMGPAERIKILLQTSISKQSLIDVIVGQYKAGGMRSLLRGTSWTVIRDVPGSFVYFGTYEAVKRSFKGNEAHPLVILLSGGLAGFISWATIFPIDTIKSKYQSSSSTFITTRQIVAGMKGNVIKSLYAGLTPTLCRAFPASAGFFSGVEASQYVLNKFLT